MRSPFSYSGSRAVTLLVIALSVAALYFAKSILLPLAVAALISFVLAPLADRLERYRLGRVMSTIVVVAAAFLAFGLVSWAVTDQAVQLSASLPDYKKNLVGKIRDLRPEKNSIFERASKTVEEIGTELRIVPKPTSETPATTAATPAPLAKPPSADASRAAGDGVMPVRVVAMPPTTSLAQVWSMVEPIFAPLANMAVVVVLITFILLRREDLRNRLIELMGRSDLRASTEALSEATRRVTGYLRTALLINTLYGVLIALGLSLIGLPNPLLWGVLGLTLRFLPYIGPWIATAIPVTLSLVVFDGWVQPLLVVALFIVLELMVNLVLEPWLYASSTGVSPLGVILAAMFWTWLWGPVGLVVAVPLTVCLVVAANYVPQLRFLSILLGDQSTLSPPEQIYQRLLALDDEEAGELARKQAASSSLPEFYDEVLLPTLILAQNDREGGNLDDERNTLVLDGLRELAEDIGTAPPVKSGSDPVKAPSHSQARILCVAASGPPCEIAAVMLQRTLAQQGLEMRISPSELLVNELVERVGEEQYDLIVVSVVPPLAIRNGRYLLKKIRLAHPDLPVVLGIWQGERLTKAKERFDADGATAVVHSMSEAAQAVRQIAIRLPLGNRPTEAESSGVPPSRRPIGKPHTLPGPVATGSAPT
ncbi:MAG: AI-2E family transporter [Planctomycetes bacterium]|nr:AI-2E family transporter [Planctomycetota bacterium]